MQPSQANSFRCPHCGGASFDYLKQGLMMRGKHDAARLHTRFVKVAVVVVPNVMACPLMFQVMKNGILKLNRS